MVAVEAIGEYEPQPVKGNRSAREVGRSQRGRPAAPAGEWRAFSAKRRDDERSRRSGSAPTRRPGEVSASRLDARLVCFQRFALPRTPQRSLPSRLLTPCTAPMATLAPFFRFFPSPEGPPSFLLLFLSGPLQTFCMR